MCILRHVAGARRRLAWIVLWLAMLAPAAHAETPQPPLVSDRQLDGRLRELTLRIAVLLGPASGRICSARP